MTLEQEVHAMLDSLSNDDSVKFIMDMIKRTEQIPDSYRNQFIKQMGWAVNDFEKEIESDKKIDENQKTIIENNEELLKRADEIKKKYDELDELGDKVIMAQDIKIKELTIEETILNAIKQIEEAKIRHQNDNMLAALEEASSIIEMFCVNPIEMESIQERVDNFNFVKDI